MQHSTCVLGGYILRGLRPRNTRNELIITKLRYQLQPAQAPLRQNVK